MRYLKLQLFFLVCGGVGPAFLIAYFALVQDGEKWILYTGAGTTALMVLIPGGADVLRGEIGR